MGAAKCVKRVGFRAKMTDNMTVPMSLQPETLTSDLQY
jgi:hypothetical protein